MSTTPPGPLAEEAARLVEAITEWARGAVGEVSLPSIGSGPECQICPICQLLALVRRTQPETFGHLTDASASMVAALRTVIDRHDHGGRRHSGVERIDLDDRDPAPTNFDSAEFDTADFVAAGESADPPEPTPAARRNGATPDRDALADALGVGRNGRTATPRGTATPSTSASSRKTGSPRKAAGRRTAPKKAAE